MLNDRSAVNLPALPVVIAVGVAGQIRRTERLPDEVRKRGVGRQLPVQLGKEHVVELLGGTATAALPAVGKDDPPILPPVGEEALGLLRPFIAG